MNLHKSKQWNGVNIKVWQIITMYSTVQTVSFFFSSNIHVQENTLTNFQTPNRKISNSIFIWHWKNISKLELYLGPPYQWYSKTKLTIIALYSWLKIQFCLFPFVLLRHCTNCFWFFFSQIIVYNFKKLGCPRIIVNILKVPFS